MYYLYVQRHFDTYFLIYRGKQLHNILHDVTMRHNILEQSGRRIIHSFILLYDLKTLKKETGAKANIASRWKITLIKLHCEI